MIITIGEYKTLDDMTAGLSHEDLHYLFVVLPLQTYEDASTVESWLLDCWKQPVQHGDLGRISSQFAAWVRDKCPIV